MQKPQGKHLRLVRLSPADLSGLGLYFESSDQLIGHAQEYKYRKDKYSYSRHHGRNDLND